jgi:5-methylcytosine-specific restriction protein A
MARRLWKEEELRSAVAAYVDMRGRVERKEPVSKVAFYRRLSERHPELSAKTFERRFMNISHVYQMMGRSWVPGLPPMHNVGTNVIATIEQLIHEVEGQPQLPVAVLQSEVHKLLKKGGVPRPRGRHSPKSKRGMATYYPRDAAVVAWVLQEASGLCECCDSSAPFTKPNGDPYLEVHHLRRLADGGTDTVENAVAICPNCHRELHHGQNQSVLLKQMYQKQSRLLRE